MTALSFSVHAEIKGKGRARGRGGQARPYTPQTTRRYESAVKSAAKEAMRRQGVALFEGCVTLSLTIRFAIPKSTPKKHRAAMLSGAIRPAKKPDASNVLKAVEDAMNGIVFKDDAQIAELVVRRFWSESEGVDVRVEALWPTEPSSE